MGYRMGGRLSGERRVALGHGPAAADRRWTDGDPPLAALSMVTEHLSSRPVGEEDIPAICGFPATLEEVSYMFPGADFPLAPEVLRKSIAARHEPTVVLVDGVVAGFAYLYDCRPGESVSIGNVIVDPHQRGKGVAKFLIETMLERATKTYRAREVKLVCFNRNVGGLLLYAKLGFKPYAVEARTAPDGERVAAIRMRIEPTE